MALAEGYIEELVVGLYDIGEIGFVQPPAAGLVIADPDYPEEVFRKLKGGRMSPHYFNGRNVTGFDKNSAVPYQEQERIRDLAIDATTELTDVMDQADPFDHVAGLPLAMTTLAGIAGYRTGKSILWLRPFEDADKGYGVHELIQGNRSPGDKVGTVDNVITDSKTKRQAAEILTAGGLVQGPVGVLVDREEGGAEEVLALGYSFHSVVGMAAVTKILAENRRITPIQEMWANEYRRRTNELLR
jgi:orotate phosphoribosyltransferase